MRRIVTSQRPRPYYLDLLSKRVWVRQGLSPADYEQKKEEVADSIAARLEPYFPGIRKAIVFRHVQTHTLEAFQLRDQAVFL